MADDRRFGRIYAPDPRDKNHPMRLLLDPLRALAFPKDVPPGKRSYRPCPIMDQGNTGTCVAHGWAAKIQGGPIIQPMPVTPLQFYREAVLQDEWTDNDFEANEPDSNLQFGSSVRGGAKAAQKRGLLKSYLWGQNAADARAWQLVGKGGVVYGITWKSMMMETDSEGFINYRGTVEGGHCVAGVGWSDFVPHRGRIVRAQRIQQSWGLPWGDKGTGFAWIEEEDLDMAMADDGECCAAVEFRVK